MKNNRKESLERITNIRNNIQEAVKRFDEEIYCLQEDLKKTIENKKNYIFKSDKKIEEIKQQMMAII